MDAKKKKKKKTTRVTTGGGEENEDDIQGETSTLTADDTVDDTEEDPQNQENQQQPFQSRDEEFAYKRQLEQKKEMERAYAARPEVSTLVTDPDSGLEFLQQGRNVMDVVTRRAVQLAATPELRLAQLFPGVPPDVRDKYRVDMQSPTLLQDLVDGYTAAAMVMLPDGNRDIPPHPSVASSAMDFLLANRDIACSYVPLESVLGRHHLRAMSLKDKAEARRTDRVWKNFLTCENVISAPFRQMILDAENRVGPNFGNLDLESFAGGHVYERCAVYIAFKGMVEHWKKKVIDADKIEKIEVTKETWTQLLNTGDPNRYLPDSPTYYTMEDCSRIFAMAQKMCQTFCANTETLFTADLPVELRFLEQADSIKGGTLLRKYVTEEFCPNERITTEALREGLRRLHAQLDNLQMDPYGELTLAVGELIDALAVGTDEGERDPYFEFASNLDPNSPGFFQTYTFNHDRLSHVRFLDSRYESAGENEGFGINIGDVLNLKEATSSIEVPDVLNNLNEMFGWDDSNGADDMDDTELRSRDDSVLPDEDPNQDVEQDYVVPKERAIGRPHELGWLRLLDDDPEDESMKLGKVPPGKIIMDP